jgi:hypothetical protein
VIPTSRAVPLALAVAALLATAACGNQSSRTAAAVGSSGTVGESASTAPAKVGGPSPAGTYTGIDGQVVDVASLRGKPTVLWFIAAGCSSCTASIPALAGHLAELKADGVQVKVIDLYDDLGQGPKAAASLTKLGRTLAGKRFDDPTWQWGISLEGAQLPLRQVRRARRVLHPRSHRKDHLSERRPDQHDGRAPLQGT